MAFANAQQSRILIGLLHASGYSKGFNGSSAARDTWDATTLIDTAFQFGIGKYTSTTTLDMLLDTDTTTNGQYDVLKSWQAATALPITYAPFGLTAGSPVTMLSSLQTGYTVSAAQNDGVKASITTQTDGPTDNGVTLVDLSAATTDASSTAIDNGAGTANGGVAHLHVTAFSGLTSDAIIVEHSTNNSVWATLGTFTTITGLTYQRLEIAAGTTVNRYLRISDDVTGTGSCTRLVAFARR